MRAVLALAMLLATPAIACDPDELERAMTEICAAATMGAEEAVEAAQPFAQSEERARLGARLAQIRQDCLQGDPAVAAREAARLARIAAHIEARADRPRPASL
jgi:hypothetical protein